MRTHACTNDYGTQIGGLRIIVFWRAFVYLCSDEKSVSSPNAVDQQELGTVCQKDNLSFMTSIQEWAIKLTTGQTKNGRIWVSVLFSKIFSISCGITFAIIGTWIAWMNQFILCENGSLSQWLEYWILLSFQELGIYLINISSFIVYLIDTSNKVETCIPFGENIIQQIDVALNIFLMIDFFIRVSTPNRSWQNEAKFNWTMSQNL